MSLLPPGIHDSLTRLLQGLSSSDNSIRTQAEDQLNNEWVQKQPDVLLMGLVEQIAASEDLSVSDALLESFQTSKSLGRFVSKLQQADAVTRPTTDAIFRSGLVPSDSDKNTKGPGSGGIERAVSDTAGTPSDGNTVKIAPLPDERVAERGPK